MATERGAPLAATETLPLYINGYFTRRLKGGERPTYGYPTNHLPETTTTTMTIVTSFMAARSNG